jgi:hypothetical protein
MGILNFCITAEIELYTPILNKGIFSFAEPLIVFWRAPSLFIWASSFSESSHRHIYTICNPLYNFLVDTKRQTRFPTAMGIEILMTGSIAALILITPSLFNPSYFDLRREEQRKSCQQLFVMKSIFYGNGINLKFLAGYLLDPSQIKKKRITNDAGTHLFALSFQKHRYRLLNLVKIYTGRRA